MALSFLIFNIFAFLVSPIASRESISCYLHDVYNGHQKENKSDIFLSGELKIMYDRSSLSVYSYNNTKWANFLLSDVNIIFNGFFSKSSAKFDNELTLSLKTNIEGITEHYKYQNNRRLMQCELDLKKHIEYKNEVNKSIQEKIVDSAHVCIEKALCDKLGSATEDDYIRAKVENYDFGPNSVMNKAFYENYPMMNSSGLDLSLQNSDKTGLQMTLNLLSDFLLASVATRVAGNDLGLIHVPDFIEQIPGKWFINDGYFNLTSAVFGNVKSLKRIGDIIIKNYGLEFKVEAAFQVTKAFVSSCYDFKYMGIRKQGKLLIDLNTVTCSVRASMNFNRRPCVTALHSLNFNQFNITFTLNDGTTVVDGAITSVANKFVKPFTEKIIQAIQSRVENTVDGLLSNFDCEQFRP